MRLGLLVTGDTRVGPVPSPSPSPRPAAAAARPIRESVERVVAQMEMPGSDPCREAKEKGVPCFPITVIHGREISVRQTLDSPLLDNGYSPDRPPTKDEMALYRPRTARRSLFEKTIDPGCVGKSALKRLQGKNDTYYLYRRRDEHGTRVALYDHRLDPNTTQGSLELLGTFVGECDALGAYSQESRRSSSP